MTGVRRKLWHWGNQWYIPFHWVPFFSCFQLQPLYKLNIFDMKVSGRVMHHTTSADMPRINNGYCIVKGLNNCIFEIFLRFYIETKYVPELFLFPQR